MDQLLLDLARVREGASSDDADALTLSIRSSKRLREACNRPACPQPIIRSCRSGDSEQFPLRKSTACDKACVLVRHSPDLASPPRTRRIASSPLRYLYGAHV